MCDLFVVVILFYSYLVGINIFLGLDDIGEILWVVIEIGYYEVFYVDVFKIIIDYVVMVFGVKFDIYIEMGL